MESDEVEPEAPKRRPGRPAGGKKGNPEFQQVTLFMPTAVYASARAKLRGRRREKGYRGPKDVSELVGALVAAWDEKTG